MAGGGLAEFARMSPQKKAVVFALLGGLLGVLYWKIVYVALDEQLEAAQAEHRGKLATSKRLGDDLTKSEDLRTHIARLREKIERNQAALPNDAEIPAFFETLQRKVAESGVEIRKWAQRSQEPVESFVRVPVDIEMAGTFMQIERFFASLVQKDIRKDLRSAPSPGDRPGEERERERERIVSIENLSLGSPTVRNREIILTARFTAVLFRQGDRPADQPGNGRPAAKPAAKPSTTSGGAPGSSPPALPGAATPAGAKAQVDQALDRADARDRNAGGVDEAKLPAAGRDRLKGGL